MNKSCSKINLLFLSTDIFQFESHRHPDFPFALAFYVNGIVHQHLSICCEWRYRSNVRLGGKKGLFGIVYVRNGKPCEKWMFMLKFTELCSWFNQILFRCQERQRRFRTATIKTRRKPIAHSTPNGTAEDIRSLIKVIDWNVFFMFLIRCFIEFFLF